MMCTNLCPTPLSWSSSSLTLNNSKSHLLSQNPQIPSKSIISSNNNNNINTSIITNKYTHFVVNTNFNRFQTSMADSWDKNESTISINEFNPFELNDMSDFSLVASPRGSISICGFGSLLSGEISFLLFSKVCFFFFWKGVEIYLHVSQMELIY